MAVRSSNLLAEKLNRTGSVCSISSTTASHLTRGDTFSTMTSSFEAPRTPTSPQRLSGVQGDIIIEENESNQRPTMIKKSSTVLSLGDEPSWLLMAPAKPEFSFDDDSGAVPCVSGGIPTPSVASKAAPRRTSGRAKQSPRPNSSRQSSTGTSTGDTRSGPGSQQRDDDSIFASFESVKSKGSSQRSQKAPLSPRQRLASKDSVSDQDRRSSNGTDDIFASFDSVKSKDSSRGGGTPDGSRPTSPSPNGPPRAKRTSINSGQKGPTRKGSQEGSIFESFDSNDSNRSGSKEQQSKLGKGRFKGAARSDSGGVDDDKIFESFESTSFQDQLEAQAPRKGSVQRGTPASPATAGSALDQSSDGFIKNVKFSPDSRSARSSPEKSDEEVKAYLRNSGSGFIDEDMPRQKSNETTCTTRTSAQEWSMFARDGPPLIEDTDDSGGYASGTMSPRGNAKQRKASLTSRLFGRGGSKSSKRRQDMEENGVIIFDWDDTLLPTTYIKQQIVPGQTPQEEIWPLKPQSPHFVAMKAHAELVEEILRAASKVARVAIVTLATGWWVETSAERYLPGFELEALCRELDMTIYPADRNSAMVKAVALSGRDPSKAAKRAAMSKCLKCLYGGSTCTWNVLSVGDSTIEREALKECCGGFSKDGQKIAICKTVKLREGLNVEDLGKDLQTLKPQLGQMVKNLEDFDRTVGTTKGSSGVSRFLRI